MIPRGRRSEKRSERRRKLAELNLLSEQKARSVLTRRGCSLLPAVGLAVWALGLLASLGVLHL